jgi:hypothetical protein
VSDVCGADGRFERHDTDGPKSAERLSSPMSEKEGTFVVTHAEAESAVLKDVDGGQVHTLSDNPGVEAGDVLEATVAPVPPMEVAYRVVEVAERRSVTVEASDQAPTRQEREIAADQAEGELTREQRAGKGELHVLTVPPEQTADAVADVVEDEGTLVRAAGMDAVQRVEVRSDESEGVLSVRYLP